MIAPVRASRATTAARQLPVIVGCAGAAVAVAVGLMAAVSLDAALLFLVPAGPLSILGGGALAARLDRTLDARGDVVRLDGPILLVPGGPSFDLARPHVAQAGWWDRGYEQRVAAKGVWLYVEQDGVAVLFEADGLARAWTRGVPYRLPGRVPERRLRLWARDVVELAVALRR